MLRSLLLATATFRHYEGAAALPAAICLLVLLVAVPRLSDMSGYLIIDETDRWRWAQAFYRALIDGDLHATLVGGGYPGIVPAWPETIWLLGENLCCSLVEGRCIADDGVYVLLHVWSRTT